MDPKRGGKQSTWAEVPSEVCSLGSTCSRAPAECSFVGAGHPQESIHGRRMELEKRGQRLPQPSVGSGVYDLHAPKTK